MKTSIAFVFLLAASFSQVVAAPADTSEPLVDSSQQIASRIINSKVPVMVDFWAPWCGPCRMVTPSIEALAKEYKGRILLVKVNIDKHVAISRYFSVQSIPAVFFVKNRAVRNVVPGARSKEDYRKAIEEILVMKDIDSTAADTAGTRPPAPKAPADSARSEI